MLWTFVGEPAFSKHVQLFHRALTKHYSQEGKHLYDPAEMEAFCDQHAPGLFGQLYKSIVNDEKEKPSKKHLKIQKTRVVSMLYNLCFLFLWKTPMLLSPFPILIYSCTEKGQRPILLKSEIDSTSCKIPTLVQTIIMFT